MTHDELLEKLDSKLQVCTCDGWDNNCWENDNQPWLALRAVVELHEPINSIRGIVCRHCFTDALHRTEFYPCPTIQTIERELE